MNEKIELYLLDVLNYIMSYPLVSAVLLMECFVFAVLVLIVFNYVKTGKKADVVVVDKSKEEIEDKKGSTITNEQLAIIMGTKL